MDKTPESNKKKKVAITIAIVVLVVCFFGLIYLLFQPNKASSGQNMANPIMQNEIPYRQSPEDRQTTETRGSSVVESSTDTLINSITNSVTNNITNSISNNVTTTSQATNERVVGRYIILERVNRVTNNDNGIINIRLLATRDRDGNIHNNRTVAYSSSSAAHPITNVLRNVVDGAFGHTNPNPNYNPDVANRQRLNQMAIPLNNQGIYIAVKLPKDQVIHRVDLYNRIDCCSDRIIGLRIRIVNSAGINKYISQTISNAAVYYRCVPHTNTLTSLDHIPTLTGRCGANFGNQVCNGAECCSLGSWCGTTPQHCNGGQRAFNGRER